MEGKVTEGESLCYCRPRTINNIRGIRDAFKIKCFLQTSKHLALGEEKGGGKIGSTADLANDSALRGIAPERWPESEKEGFLLMAS